jgi:hypothetical protein
VVGSDAGAVARRIILGLYPGFPLRARLGFSVTPSLASAASHAACGFTALRARLLRLFASGVTAEPATMIIGTARKSAVSRLRIFVADDLRANLLPAVCRHGIHVGLAFLTPDRIL